MGRSKRPTSPALRIAYERYVGDDHELRAVYEEELANAEVARTIYELRTRAQLTQRELARRAGTNATVISRLEDATYGGPSLAMLRRIAAALDRRVEIRFVPRTSASVREAGPRGKKRKASSGGRRRSGPLKG